MVMMAQMTRTELIGYLAATLTTISFVPQAWLSWKARRSAGVSLSMYVIFSGGVALWLGYGVLLHAWPIVIANSITLTLALFILVLRVRYRA